MYHTEGTATSNVLKTGGEIDLGTRLGSYCCSTNVNITIGRLMIPHLPLIPMWPQCLQGSLVW